MAPTDPLPIRLAQTLGLSTSLILSGVNLTMSVFLVPRILESPVPLLLQQWKRTFLSGKAAAPPIAIISAFSYFYLSYQTHKADPTDRKAWVYAAAGALVVGIVPYTLLFMSATNNKLLAKAKDVEVLAKGDEYVESKGEGSAHQLVDWWGVLNLGRAVMLAVGGVLGVWTAVN